ncbi:MAG: PAS domain S-box protein [Bacteroidetes bacterium]|nr:PAS domain S-box protein [Bacteroidota bacterium]
MKKTKTTNEKDLRIKAEEQFKSKTGIIPLRSDDLELSRLVQELQIHQIELEMQNDELKKARDEAENLSLKYAELYDLAPTGYFTFDRSGIIEQLNITGSTMLGLPRSRVIRTNFAKYVSQKTKNTFNEFVNQVFKSKNKETCEVFLTHNNGSRILVNIEGLFCEESNKCNSVVMDVTRHRETEEKILLSERKLRSLFSVMTDCILMIDVEGRFVEIAPTNNSFLDKLPEELIGRTLYNVFPVEQVKIFLHHFKRALSNNSTVESDFSISSAGDDIWYEAKITPLGHNTVLMVVSDITERKRTELQILEYAEELKAANELKDKFSRILAHDLRAPFNPLLGLSSILVNEIESLSNEEIREYCTSLNEGLKQQFVLLTDLLEWSRLHEKNSSSKPETVLLPLVIREVIQSLTLMSDQKGIRIENNADNDFTLLVDPNLLKLVLRNLISNSIKFTNKNGVIKINAERKKKFVEVSISDTGVGIAEEDLVKLFVDYERYSTEGTANERGTGLGLLLCKEVVEKFGGKIRVLSEVGKGSTFSFTLPAL